MREGLCKREGEILEYNRVDFIGGEGISRFESTESIKDTVRKEVNIGE
jgi:hypothetical protein